MKKGLSVLLIAAALFGFYGGATNLNDVLACKDYFTSASGASDDMQRLEDGNTFNLVSELERELADAKKKMHRRKTLVLISYVLEISVAALFALCILLAIAL